MSSPFGLLTAGGARFDKSRYRHDIELFASSSAKRSKGKNKDHLQSRPLSPVPNSLDILHSHRSGELGRIPSSKRKLVTQDSDPESSSSSSTSSRPSPPQQKITLTGSSPLPKSLHSNLPSLLNHPFMPSSSRTGGPLLSALQASGIHSLWGVQCAVGGCLFEGRDTMCVAPTGSGKTLAYVLPTIVKLQDPARMLRQTTGGKGVRVIVVVPTHDLAIQIQAVVRAVTRGRAWRFLMLTKATERAICQGSPGHQGADAIGGQDADEHEQGSDDNDGELDEDNDEEDPDLRDRDGSPSQGHSNEDVRTNHKTPLGIDVLIATPERLHHLVDSGQLSLAWTRHLILDECDRLLSPDFLPQVEPILAACSHPEVQKCFLSATMPAGAEEIAKKWLRDSGVRVVVGIKDSAVTTVSQSLLYAGSESGKLLAFRDLISSGQVPYPSLIFVQSVSRADELYKNLIMDGLRVDVVHGNKGKTKRDEAIKAFREGKIWMLVVTEVLARGMDFKGVKVVINYDFPQTVQSYIHRIGRTGRAGRPGKAITFCSTEDGPYLRTIANVLRASGCPVPQYMLDLPKPSKNLKRKIAKVPVKRKQVGGDGRDVGKELGRRRREMVEGSKRRTVKELRR